MKVALCAERFEVFDGILLTMKGSEGFQERAHTADWELEVWSSGLAGLLEQAALGMLALMGIRLEEGLRQVRTLIVSGIDAESLLVRFLSEVLWLAEHEKLGFDTFEIEIKGEDASLILDASMEGAPIISVDKEIKAVTYHNLEVRQTGNGLEAYIVFDV